MTPLDAKLRAREAAQQAQVLDKMMDRLAAEVAGLAGLAPDSDEITDLIWNGASVAGFINHHFPPAGRS